MSETMPIRTLSDLFYRLFRGGGEPVIQGQPRRNREDYFQMLFPESLCRQYEGKAKANLTWFFNDDRTNKAIKRSLIRLLCEELPEVLGTTHRKCAAVLWPDGQHPAFQREALERTLAAVRVPGGKAGTDFGAMLERYFRADPAAALARVILTLAVASDAPEDLIRRIWSRETEPAEDGQWRRSVEGHIRRGNLLYLNGQRQEAFRVYEKAAARLGREAQTREESELYCRLGTMLASGDGHYRDPAGAVAYLRLGCLPENPESYYLLARYGKGPEADQALERAGQLGWPPALRELGNGWYYGRGREKDRERARQCFREGMAPESDDGAYCACMLGRIYQEEGDLPAALSAYGLAREWGSREAARRLEELEQPSAPVWVPEQAEAAPGAGGICLSNRQTGGNPDFLESLPDGWETEICVRETALVRKLRELVRDRFGPDRETFPELIVALLSEDRQDNLCLAAAALGVLEQAAAALGSRKWDLVRAVRIYAAADRETGALFLDAAYDTFTGAAIPLRLCDADQDAVEELFAAAPLFLPCMGQKAAPSLRLVILGNTETAMAALRKALCLPLDRPVSIRVFGPEAGDMALRFRELCPGVTEGAAETVTVPTFHDCGLLRGEMTQLLRRHRRQEPGVDDAGLLGQGNYYIIAAGTDEENLRLAVQLRRELLKADPGFTNLPFIAVHVRSEAAARLASRFRPGGREEDRRWYSQYDLFCFGSGARYTYAGLKEDLLEKQAQEVHLQYAGEDPNRHRALGDYYRMQYNRDSSRMVAVYARYRLFAAGFAPADWRMYAIPDQLGRLAEGYGQWLEDPVNLEAAARLEHSRWNCYLLSQGWEPAAPSQVETYVQRGSPTHQLHLAKLHPFLCPWEELEQGGRLASVREAVYSRLPEARIQDPREADARTAADTVRLLTIR